MINEGPAFGMADHKPSAGAKHACRIAARSGLSAMLPYMAFMKIASTLVEAKASEASRCDTHLPENLSKTPFEVIAVELKR